MAVGISQLGRAAVAAVMCAGPVSTATAGMTTDTFGSGANQFNIDFVTIDGSTNPTSGYGIVNNDYRIGVYEITNDQWNKFKAEYGTITGTPSSAYDSDFYDWGTGTTNVPTNRASWYEAAQFVNWLNTSSGHQAAYKFSGTQGTSSYTLDIWSPAEADNGTNLYRHKDAFYYLPTEDEWVKAGYWNGTSRQTYATKPGDTLHQGDGTSGKGWNYFNGSYATNPLGPWDVGSGSEELNGTFDMMGNVWEWMESPFSDTSYGVGSNRGLRGGSFIRNDGYLASSSRGIVNPDGELSDVGFRVASEVPVVIPSPLALPVGLAGLLLAARRRRAPFSL